MSGVMANVVVPMRSAQQHFTRTEKQRAIGAVLGAAVADALGAPFEFKPAGTYRKRFPAPVLGGVGEMVGGGGFSWAAGEFTDDTQMAMLIAETMLRCGGYNADVLWVWFRAWASTANDVGVNTRRSLGHADWRDVANNGGHGVGNGALMRAFVIAVAFLDADDDTVRAVVLHQAALTHQDPAAGWGAWIAVEMIRRAIRGLDPLAGLDGLVAVLPDEVRSGFELLLAATWTPDEESPSNATVWGCLAEAVWALRTTTSFEDAVVAAVSRGNDADTVGCVTGALAGAVYGVQAIPSRWATYVHGKIDTPEGVIRYNTAEIQRLVHRLLGSADRPEHEPERPAGPQEVAPGLYAADLLGATQTPNDWAVVSLCRAGDRFLGHPIRREVYLIDEEGDHNFSPGLALRDAVEAVDALLAEGRNVVVHCHGGRSRTGLVIKAWKMRHDGITERDAHQWLNGKWSRYADYNQAFVSLLQGEWQCGTLNR